MADFHRWMCETAASKKPTLGNYTYEREMVKLKLAGIALKRPEMLRHTINKTRRQGKRFWCIFISILMPKITTIAKFPIQTLLKQRLCELGVPV